MLLRIVTGRKSQVAGRMRRAYCLLRVLFASCILLLASLACATATPTPPLALRPARPTATRPPTPTARLAPSPTIEPNDTGWQSLGNGIELRRWLVEMNGVTNRLWLARVDPARVNLRVLYDKSNPRLLSEWFAAAKPLLAVNAGYFTEDNMATGLIISDGKRSGQSYTGFGGMLAVWGKPTERVEVRWLVAKPYNPSESLRQAVQAFPMLVHPSGKPGITEDDGQISRRTVVGQDRKGRIVFVVSSEMFFTLKTLSAFLAASDLELDTALNLDGGTSSGMLIAGREGTVGVDSWIKLPAVIVVESR